MNLIDCPKVQQLRPKFGVGLRVAPISPSRGGDDGGIARHLARWLGWVALVSSGMVAASGDCPDPSVLDAEYRHFLYSGCRVEVDDGSQFTVILAGLKLGRTSMIKADAAPKDEFAEGEGGSMVVYKLKEPYHFAVQSYATEPGSCVGSWFEQADNEVRVEDGDWICGFVGDGTGAGDGVYLKGQWDSGWVEDSIRIEYLDE